jgi:hypothetical protein
MAQSVPRTAMRGARTVAISPVQKWSSARGLARAHVDDARAGARGGGGELGIVAGQLM